MALALSHSRGGLRERPVPTKRVERIGPGGTKQEEGVSNF